MFIVRETKQNRLKPHRAAWNCLAPHMPPRWGLAESWGAALL